jgi:hypothetical protein
VNEFPNGGKPFDPFKTRDWSDELNVGDDFNVAWRRLTPLQDVQPWTWEEFTSRYDGWLSPEAVNDWKQLCFRAQDEAEGPSLHPMLTNVPPASIAEAERALYASLRTRPPGSRVFVSYRSADRRLANALRSYLLNRGKRVWMDVWDPALLTATALPSHLKSRLTAAIIEIALLRSTHLVVVHTAKTASSFWVPYEIGRAKHRQLVAPNAAFWHGPARLPGYALLVPTFHRIHDAPIFEKWVDRI